MKRSEINSYIKEAEEFFRQMGFYLPPWAFWAKDQWESNLEQCTEIITNGLGWDLTDFGSGSYRNTGLLLFTLRNGKPGVDGKTYAEKIMLVKEMQETPFHFHWMKMEDIINRGGGNLVIELYKADKREGFSKELLDVHIDGRIVHVKPGQAVTLAPGESICLEPYIYHRFYGEKGTPSVLVGEVSMVNDDKTDNRFKTALGRFPKIEEDTDPYRLLITDYSVLKS